MSDTTKNTPLEYTSIGAAPDSILNAQWWLLFAVMVANKPADITERKLKQFLGLGAVPPIERMYGFLQHGVLRQRLEECKTGQYNRIEKAFCRIIEYAKEEADPRQWSFESIIDIPGIGPKTASWFYMLVHPDANVAALDTHVLKHLKFNGVPNVPKGTPPTGPTYDRLQSEFLNHAKLLGLKASQLDYFVWAVYRAGGSIKLPCNEIPI